MANAEKPMSAGPSRYPDYVDRVRFMLTHSGMFVPRSSYESVVGWLHGYDEGRGGVPLLGLKE